MPSARVRRRLVGRDDVVLFGRLPRERALATATQFDVAVYPRTQDTGIQAAKVAEFMGLGVPTVSYDYEVTEVLGQTGAGILVDGPRAFVGAVVHLLEDGLERGRIADLARRAGAQLDWDVLARRFEVEVLDRYLPPA
jgi:glycosyltransferase involved in cell wall biosynthesis